MEQKLQSRPDLLLLLSLLLVILLTPVMDHGGWRRLVLAGIMFIPVIIATVRLSQIKVSVWPTVLLMLGSLVFAVASNIFENPTLSVFRWGFLAAFFAVTAMGLFSYIRHSPSITASHLYTAVNIYLVLGLLWAALYCAMDAFDPAAIQLKSSIDRQSELLYFSLITLATVGYGDIVPLSGEARVLAALEGICGVLYIAITVAILVSRFKHEALDKNQVD